MGKDIQYITIHFNYRVGVANNFTSKQISGLSKDFEQVAVKEFLADKASCIPEWVMLKGKKEEVAFIETVYEDRGLGMVGNAKHKIIFEFPLSLTVDDIRFFTENALKLFKDKFTKEFEFAFDGNFKRITKRPHKEGQGLKNFPNSRYRETTFADKKPHNTNRGEVLKRRDKWIREKYKIYKKQGSSDDAYYKIQENLNKLSNDYFGEWNAKKLKPNKLGIDSIKRIIQSKF